MKKLWLGSSWKMNKTSSDVAGFCDAIASSLATAPAGLQTFLIPPFPYVEQVTRALTRPGTLTGVQNACWAESGAFTGEVSMTMARDIGASLVEIGHSERRALFNETDETVNLKTRAALAANLRPLVCVGDTLQEKHWQVSLESIVRQVKIALHCVEPGQLSQVILAYEPVWAIGESGIPATAAEAESGLASIRQALIQMYGEQAAHGVTLLYGGSVNPDNAQELVQQPSIDGLFVGRSAWEAEGYAQLIDLIRPYCNGEQND